MPFALPLFFGLGVYTTRPPGPTPLSDAERARADAIIDRMSRESADRFRRQVLAAEDALNAEPNPVAPIAVRPVAG